jgi:hypothetical protein
MTGNGREVRILFNLVGTVCYQPGIAQRQSVEVARVILGRISVACTGKVK